ncbi:MAG: hypothetical protein EOP61_24860 [Sphingomonadales bacterium]|nr:MAG: hypothetical protein EOP61_24860 [Sphingomonadales bacterium]
MLTATLVDHVLDTPFEAFPAHVVEDGRLRLIDALSCTVGGARVPSNLAALGLARSAGGNPQATVLLHGDRLPLATTAMLNALNCRAFDFEVTGPEAEGANAGKMVGHVCSTTEPTAFSVAEHVRASGKELLAAVILGGDIGARIAVADRFEFDKCFEVCGTANAFGAAALAGRLLGANHDQLHNAFGILVNMIGGSFQSLWDGVDTFKLPGALAAQNAVTAVQMAMAGFTGIREPLESPQGYFALFGNNPTPANAALDLGTLYYSKGMHKLHPSCYGIHNPMECALEIVRNNTIDPAAIERVTLDVPPNRIKHFLNQPMHATDAQPRALFSIPFGVANVLLRGSSEIEHYTEGFIHQPELIALTEKVTLVPSLPMDVGNHAGTLTVYMKDGTSFSASREVPLGWAENPVGPEMVRDKYWRNLSFAGSIPNDNASHALDLLERLESVDDVSEIAALLVA